MLHPYLLFYLRQVFANQGSEERRYRVREKLWNKYNFWYTAKNSKYTLKYRECFYPTIGSTGVMLMDYQLCLLVV
jgi:hypothetical protein